MNVDRRRYLCAIATMILLHLAPPSAEAELVVTEDAEGQEGLTVYRLSVSPAAEPKPALKHRLTLRPEERKPGNAATHYLRSYAENALSAPWKAIRDKFGTDTVNDWGGIETPIKALPMEQVREATRAFDSYVECFIAPASRCRECEWGLAEEDLRGSDTYTFMLPDAQQSRDICRALALRTRLAIAEGRYDDAIEHMRMNYQLGQDMAKQRFIVCSLIGIAEVGVTSDTLLDLMAAPDSPNMYWALTELPRPLIDMREAIRLEMSLGKRVSPALLDSEQQEHTPEEWARLLAESFEPLKEFGELGVVVGVDPHPESDTLGNLVGPLVATGYSLVVYPAAKLRLVASGINAADVEAMSVGQVMLVDAAREYQRVADEYEKWWYVDYLQARSRMREAERAIGGSRFEGGMGRSIANLLLPAIYAARSAQMRSEWQMGALRVIEAIRMHAAERGELPRTLNDITVVPVPVNPITLQPYQYRLDGKTAVLELPFSDGMSGVARRFEITLAE